MSANDNDPGILGNLPRSRPGTRSEKRAVEERQEAASKPVPASARKRTTNAMPAKARARRAAKAGAGKSPTRKTGRPVQDSGRRPASPPPPTPAAERSDGGNLAGGAVKAAGQLAEAGVTIAVEVTKAVLKRLPRP